jgi:hypothetical protein
MKRLSIMIAVIVTLLAGCVPATGSNIDSSQVAMINGPSEERLEGLAELLEEQVSALPDCCRFSFLWSSPIRAQERQRDMFGGRAPLQAAYLARNLGAGWPVLVGTTGFERTVEEGRDGYFITGTLAVQALVINVADGTVMAEVTSDSFSGSRWQSRRESLPGERQDPLMEELARQAAAELAPRLLAVLNDLAGR